MKKSLILSVIFLSISFFIAPKVDAIGQPVPYRFELTPCYGAGTGDLIGAACDKPNFSGPCIFAVGC